MLRSADQAYTIAGDGEQKRLLPIMLSLQYGATLRNLHVMHKVSSTDLDGFLVTLNDLGVVTDDPSQRQVIATVSRSLTEEVRLRLPTKKGRVHLPESGGLWAAARYFAPCSQANPLLYGVRIDSDYFVIRTLGEWWLEPHELLQRLYRGSLKQEDLPLIECLMQPFWPSNVPYYTDLNIVSLGLRIAEAVSQERSGVWQFKKDGTVLELTTRLAPRKLNCYTGLRDLEDVFVGDGKIVAECNTLATIERGEVVLAFAAARVGYPRLTPAHVYNDVWNWGVGKSVEEARLKSIVEAIERYSCGRGDALKTRTATYRELGPEAIHPRELGAYDPHPLQEYFLALFDEETHYSWYFATGVSSNEGRWVLPDYVLYPLEPQDVNTAPLYYGTSSGTAGHITLREAQENALAELCEREAMMITWYNRLSPPRVVEQTLPVSLQQRIAALKRDGYQVYIIDLTMELLPTAGVIAIGQGNQRVFTFGMSASPLFVKGVEKALAEVEIMLLLTPERDMTRMITRESVRSPHDHATYYMDPTHLDEIRFLCGSPDVVVSAAKEPRSLEQVFHAAGLTAYYIDVTCREVAESGVPLRVVRALVPGMVPIAYGYRLHSLGLERLYTVPVKVGKRQSPITREEIDLDAVHPFC